MNQKVLAFFVAILVVISLYFLITEKKDFLLTDKKINPKAVVLKNYLLQQPKPQKIEIFSYTKKFEKDVLEIKKLKIPQDKNSTIYITIQFFTDEDDPKAPLIAQIKLLDVKSQNLIKEESINLE